MIMVKVASVEAQLINIEQIIVCSIEQTDAVVKSYGKCSKISNTLKLRTPKIITENNF